MDLAEYRTLFVLSFTTPAFDSDVAPSFGTLLATINVALSMLGEVEYSNRLQDIIAYLSFIPPSPHKVKDPIPSKAHAPVKQSDCHVMFL